MEPLDPLEVIISVRSSETEVKGGHAVNAWNQSAQLVVVKGGEGGALREKTRALVSRLTREGKHYNTAAHALRLRQTAIKYTYMHTQLLPLQTQ